MEQEVTALTDYIDQLRTLASIHPEGGIKQGYLLAATLAESMLPKEKEIIEGAFDIGRSSNGIPHIPQNGKDFFNKTYK